jgi:hypothetical protein
MPKSSAGIVPLFAAPFTGAGALDEDRFNRSCAIGSTPALRPSPSLGWPSNSTNSPTLTRLAGRPACWPRPLDLTRWLADALDAGERTRIKKFLDEFKAWLN